MSRSTKLQPIAKISEQEERQAGRSYGESVRQLEQQRRQLDELISYRRQYEASFQVASESGMSAIRMQEYKLFIERLDDAIRQQQQILENGRQKCVSSQKYWLHKRSKRKMIDTVIENRQQEERLHAEKREQKELEDRPYIKGKQNTPDH